MQLQLAAHIHMAQIQDDVVILDVEADAYYCWRGGTEALRPDGRSVHVLQDEAGRALQAARFISETSSPVSSELARLAIARTSLEQVAPGMSARCSEVASLVFDHLSAARKFKRAAFADLVVWARTRNPLDLRRFAPPTADLTWVASRYIAMRVWSPIHGACLLRSYMMLRHLRDRGHDATWVIGVRTWPFEAHCWLQVGDVALDEDIERLRAFTPILAV